MSKQLNIVHKFSFGGATPLVKFYATRVVFGIGVYVLFFWVDVGVGIETDVLFYWVDVGVGIIDIFAYWYNCRVITDC